MSVNNKEYYLMVRDYDYIFVMAHARLTQEEAKVMFVEVEVYNHHISDSKKGNVPSYCYNDPNEQHNRYVAHRRRFDDDDRPVDRSLYEPLEVVLSLVDEDGIDEDGDPAYEDNWDELKQSKPSLDISFFTRPLTRSDAITLGFVLLPMTEKMMKDCREGM